jgi:hypothetical protein
MNIYTLAMINKINAVFYDEIDMKWGELLHGCFFKVLTFGNERAYDKFNETDSIKV